MMDVSRMLSGSQVVAKGATKKIDGKLPEVGLKEVSPIGSWLEEKQIQSALEARKHLIEVARIEKSGSLSHAVWRDDLQLAEVTQQTGGHWQYIGHNVGKHLYLLPEETLFLIEVATFGWRGLVKLVKDGVHITNFKNCLLLKHNEVTVSLQKAYSLCLGNISIMQYKVYASLSRLGYRVFRHKEPKLDTNDIKNVSMVNKISNGTDPMGCANEDDYKNIEHLDKVTNEEDVASNAVNNHSQQNTVKEDLKCESIVDTHTNNCEQNIEANKIKDTANNVNRSVLKVETFQPVPEEAENENFFCKNGIC